MTALQKHGLFLGIGLLTASVLMLFSFSSHMAEKSCIERGGELKGDACVFP